MENYANLLNTIGSTPIVEFKNITRDYHFNLTGKLEFLNPGGSIKDRVALNMLKSAFEREDIDNNTTIIESSSGNLGVGLAMVCKAFGLKFICVVDPKTTKQNIGLIKAYGGTVEIANNADPITNDYIQARIDRVKSLLEEHENSYWTDQYSNHDNSNAHHVTMDEIYSSMNGQVDFIFCATSTCGTLRGCSEYRKNHNRNTKVIAVDATGSVIFNPNDANDRKIKKRYLPGYGAGRVPELFQPNMEDSLVYVDDQDCVNGCNILLENEAVLAGASSGGVISAVLKYAQHIPKGSNCAAILCDRGERYLDTVYDQEWVLKYLK